MRANRSLKKGEGEKSWFTLVHFTWYFPSLPIDYSV